MKMDEVEADTVGLSVGWQLARESTRTSGARGEAQAVKAVPGSWTGGVLTRS